MCAWLLVACGFSDVRYCFDLYGLVGVACAWILADSLIVVWF